jgi:hypothetical protein
MNKLLGENDGQIFSYSLLRAAYRIERNNGLVLAALLAGDGPLHGLKENKQTLRVFNQPAGLAISEAR